MPPDQKIFTFKSKDSDDPLSLKDYLKVQLLRNRIGLSSIGTIQFLERIQNSMNQLIGLPPDKINFDLEFKGREVDLVFTYEEPVQDKERTGR